jgi:hypothetical protein
VYVTLTYQIRVDTLRATRSRLMGFTKDGKFLLWDISRSRV